MRRSSKILSVIGGTSFLVGLLLAVIFALSFQRGFYSYEYAKGHQAEVVGMSDEGLMQATDTLLDYLKDKRDDIVTVTEVNGYEQEVYNVRETLHMVDVKELVQHAETAEYLLLAGGAVLLAAAALLSKKHWPEVLAFGYKNGLILLGLFIAFIAIWAMADFYNFWMDFHYLFFDNDLFILDPNTSIMINMFPETFFFDLVILIIGVYAVLLALIAWVLHIFKKRKAIHD